MTLPEILKFSEMLNTFRNVERILYANGTDRMENDVEHSYQMAMLAWFIASQCDTGLDIDRVIRYALIHDLVEVYAGDTYIYSTDQVVLDSKASREHDALIRLQREFPGAESLLASIDAYEKREDRESRFVYALDKAQPLINILLDDGRIWKEQSVTWEMLLEKKADKVSISPELERFFKELMGIIEGRKDELFSGDTI